MVNIIYSIIFLIHKYTTLFSIIQYQRVKKTVLKSVVFLYIKKDKKQVQKRIILNNLFTTLQCQRTNNLRQARSRKAGEQRKVVEPTKKSLYIRRMANLSHKIQPYKQTLGQNSLQR